jgi:type IV pilus assembly protein PilY1
LAVKYTCKNGYLSDNNNNAVGSSHTSVLDYAVIPNAYKVLTGVTIANEYATGGYARSNASTLMYKLKITPDGYLSLSYSVNGGSWLGVLTNQSITAQSSAIPANIRFGFAGSTGGGSNIHEVLCFKAASLDTSSSSVATNLKQSAKVTSSSQAYFAYYDPNDWTGRLTANSLNVDTSGNLTIASTANWDASCVLTGVLTGKTCTATGVAGPTTAESPTSRVILSWNGSSGVPFEWNGSSPALTTAQQNALDAGDSTQTAARLNYLRGDRSNEVTTSGSGLFRDRDGVLGDIVDSSPTPVGQPVLPYSIVWKDKLNPTTAMAENSGTQTYAQFVTAEATRENIVYAGANDGLLHGFEAGSYTTSNAYDSSTNDGKEVLAYMPAAVVNTIHNSSTVELDYANPQYGHNFYVDAPPGDGDLFYQNVWHTWLVGGMGPGGAAIYALDVTTPGNFSESNASSLVIGEWSAANLTCSNVTSCANSLGNTYGTPVIRRLHNGMWAVIFGNGFGSSSGDAGIYIRRMPPIRSTT